MIIYVDIDGTICTQDNMSDSGGYKNAEPRYEQIYKINKLYEQGNEIVYWTARGGTTGIDWSRHTKQQIDIWGCRYSRIETKKKQSWD